MVLLLAFNQNSFEISPEDGPGRVVGTFGFAARRGFTLISAYSWHGEGWSPRRIFLLWMVIQRVRITPGSLWLMAGELNV